MCPPEDAAFSYGRQQVLLVGPAMMMDRMRHTLARRIVIEGLKRSAAWMPPLRFLLEPSPQNAITSKDDLSRRMRGWFPDRAAARAWLRV